jgi:hypothetical protein
MTLYNVESPEHAIYHELARSISDYALVLTVAMQRLTLAPRPSRRETPLPKRNLRFRELPHASCHGHKPRP